jgi:hypothetical protein
MSQRHFHTALLSFVLAGAAAADPATLPDAPNPLASDVVWDSPSENSLGSMPLGNGDIGANVWVEPSGDLLLLLSKTDAFDDFSRLLKIGRIRIQTTPALVQAGQPFEKRLNLHDGCIDIRAGETSVRVWIDANHPVVQADFQSDSPFHAEATVEIWRTETRMLDRKQGGETEAHGAYGNFPEKQKVHPDVVLPHDTSSIAWCHHNIESQWEPNLRHTGLEAEIPRHTDPILRRTFGALIRGSGMQPGSDLVLRSTRPEASRNIQITLLTQFADSPADWRKAVHALAEQTPSDSAARFAAHRAWWHGFWNRSWVSISGGKTGAFADTVNQHPWRVGVASDGGSRFQGEIAGAKVEQGATTVLDGMIPAEPPGEEESSPLPGADIAFEEGLTVSAWIKAAAGESGRILDKATAGRPGGYTFDTHPGLSLRWIVDRHTMIVPRCLTPGRWYHVAATADPATGLMRVFLDGNLLQEQMAPPATGDPRRVTRAYALQRFINACAGRGRLPIKFNGTLFTVDEVFDPDYRRWGGPYWLQNTRLPYWSMLASGDYDLMQPLFRMCLEVLPLRKAATKTYFGHDGAHYPETFHFWGNYADANYGFNRGDLPRGITENRYIRRHWVGIIEIVGMMLDYYEATRDEGFRDTMLIPLATETFRFYDQHWPRGDDGKILYSPSQSLETYFETVNPTPDIAGIRYLIPRLLQLPVPDALRAEWERQLADQPEIPMSGGGEDSRILPAQEFGAATNVENPELYAVFPFRLFTLATVSREELQTAVNSYHARRNQANEGWQQGPIWAAMLGLTQEARTAVVQRATTRAAGYRFPGFYGPYYDWTPDQDHISVFQTAVQTMLMQCEGDKILLLPAWPLEWDVDFKLHAPKNTTVECKVRDGRIEKLVVTPASRHEDVETGVPFEGGVE